MGVCVPVAGSRRNDPTGTLGSGDTVGEDGAALGGALAVARSRRSDGNGSGVPGGAMSAGGADERAADVGMGDPLEEAPSGVEPGAADALSGDGDGAGTIVTARVSSVGLPAGRTALPRIWSPSQAEKTDAWSVVRDRALRSPTCQT
jgi:hypothetical protein